MEILAQMTHVTCPDVRLACATCLPSALTRSEAATTASLAQMTHAMRPQVTALTNSMRAVSYLLLLCSSMACVVTARSAQGSNATMATRPTGTAAPMRVSSNRQAHPALARQLPATVTVPEAAIRHDRVQKEDTAERQRGGFMRTAQLAGRGR